MAFSVEQNGVAAHSLMLLAVGADARLMAKTTSSRNLSLTSSGLLRRRWPAVLRILHAAAICRPAVGCRHRAGIAGREGRLVALLDSLRDRSLAAVR